MKSKVIVAVFMILVSVLARADRTYIKDRTDCRVSGLNFSLELRSAEKYSTSDDDSYGDHIVINYQERSFPVVLNDQGIGRYRLLNADNRLCTKPLAIKISDAEVAIFLSKDNRPFANTVVVLHYNLKTQVAEIFASKIQASNAYYSDGKAYFKQAPHDTEEKSGTVFIGNEKFNFVEKTFEPWISFDGKIFRLDREITYNKFDQKDLLPKSRLENLNEFQEIKYKVALSPKLGKSCLSFNHQDWVCN